LIISPVQQDDCDKMYLRLPDFFDGRGKTEHNRKAN
jgi:hypothetical protein